MLFKIALFIISVSLSAKTAAAQGIGLDPNRDIPGVKPDVWNPAATLGIVIQNVIVIFFTIGALGFVIYFIWGAVDWILSGGDKEKIAGARKRITTSIIGLVVLSLSFVAMQVIGQILGIGSLMNRDFYIPKLLP